MNWFLAACSFNAFQLTEVGLCLWRRLCLNACVLRHRCSIEAALCCRRDLYVGFFKKIYFWRREEVDLSCCALIFALHTHSDWRCCTCHTWQMTYQWYCRTGHAWWLFQRLPMTTRTCQLPHHFPPMTCSGAAEHWWYHSVKPPFRRKDTGGVLPLLLPCDGWMGQCPEARGTDNPVKS